MATPPALAQASARTPVSLSAPDQQRLGVVAAALELHETTVTEPAFIRVIDPALFAAIESDRIAATAAANASRAQWNRLRKLAIEDQSASQQSVEAAKAQATADDARASLLARRLTVEWGSTMASMSDTARAELLADLVGGDAALLRADAPGRPDGVEGVIHVKLAPERSIAASRMLGLTGAADGRMQTVGLFGVALGAKAAGLRPGRMFDGAIETNLRLAGVVIPRDAIVRLDGAAWAYFQVGAAAFERREIIDPVLLESGWFVSFGAKPGDRLVTRGAGALLAVERADESAEAN